MNNQIDIQALISNYKENCHSTINGLNQINYYSSDYIICDMIPILDGIPNDLNQFIYS